MNEEKNIEDSESKETSVSSPSTRGESFERLMKKMESAATEKYNPGGVVTGSGTMSVGPVPRTTTGTTTGTWPPLSFPPPGGKVNSPAPKKARQVALPTKITEKFLVAIMDPDTPEDDVIWAATLRMTASQFNYDEEGGEMTITFSLEDVYDNVKES